MLLQRGDVNLFFSLGRWAITLRQRDLSLNLGTVSRDVFLFLQECGVASEAPMKPALMAKVIPTADHVPVCSKSLTSENMNDLGYDLRSEITLAINASFINASGEKRKTSLEIM
ncbi:hypothetical protein J6590_068950 [Homalodisca vitripennis]|nr:hypothetical protein J6590_068950 [Homalodisca vitripennis]